MKKNVLGYFLIVALSLVTWSVQARTDTLSVVVLMPLEEDDVVDVHRFTDDVSDVFRQVETLGMEIDKVIVSGSASPDGPLDYNLRLSRQRADNAASYLVETMKIDRRKLIIRYMNEDWRHLEFLISQSDLSMKTDLLAAMANVGRDERKAALMRVGGGQTWNVLLEDFFPQLRYVRVDVIGDVPVEAKELQPQIQEEREEAVIDYITDIEAVDDVPVQKQVAQDRSRCWRVALKTNLLADVVSMPSIGFEFQLGDYMSFDIQGNIMAYNLFSTTYRKSYFYALSPELRFWIDGKSMREGHFLGVHGNYAVYSMQWLDGLVYQNGTSSIWDGILDEVMPVSPAWSAGLAYGYSFGFGERNQWGVEIFAGAGYLNTVQDVQSLSSSGNLEFIERQKKHGWGLTKAGVNITYRFCIL